MPEVRDDLLEKSFAEAESGGFFAGFHPSDEVKAKVQEALNFKGKYQPRFVQTRFLKLAREHRRSFLRHFIVAPCMNEMVDGLGATRAEPLVSELWSVADEALEVYPPAIVRLVLLEALVNTDSTSPGVIEYVALTHPKLRVAGDPQLVEPVFDQARDADDPGPELTAGEAEDEFEPLDNALSNLSQGPTPVDDVELARVAALGATRDTLVRIEEGRLPTADDLALLAAYSKRFTELVEDLRSFGEHVPTDEVTLAGLRLLYEKATSRPFVDLEEFGHVRSQRPIDCLDEVIAEALRLAAATGTPSDEDRTRAEGLMALLDAIRKPRSEEPSLEQDVKDLIPSHWLKLVHAIEFGLVTIPAQTGLEQVDSRSEPHPSLVVSSDGGDRATPQSTNDPMFRPKPDGEALAEMRAGVEPHPASIAIVPAEAALPEPPPAEEVQKPSPPSEPAPVVMPEIDAAESATDDQHEAGRTTAEDPNWESLGRELLSAGRLAPYYWWAKSTATNEADTVSLSVDAALAAVLLDGSRSSLDDFAYRASVALTNSVRATLKPGSADLAITAALAVAGAAGTGHEGMRAALVQLEAQPNPWSDKTRSTMRQLADAPLGGIATGAPQTNPDEEVPTGASAVDLEAEWAQRFRDEARHRRSKYQPATVVWQELVKPDGPHGVLASAAEVIAQGDRLRRDQVRQVVDDLSSRADIQHLIDRVTRSTPRLHNHTTIVAAARQRLLTDIEETIEHFERWLNAISQAEQADARGDRPSTASTITESDITAALVELLRPIQDTPQLQAEVLRIARHALTLWATPTLSHRPDDPIEQWIGWQLDVDASIPSDAQLQADRALLTRGQLLPPDTDLIESNCKRLLEAGELARVQAVADAIERLHPELANDLAAAVAHTRSIRLGDLRRECDQIESLLGQARAFGLITDELASDILTDLEIVRLDDGRSVQALSAQLVIRSTDLKARLAERGTQLRTRISELAEAGALDVDRRRNLLNRLDADDLRTVEEQLARIDEGGDLGSAAEGLVDVRQFFPNKVHAAASLKPDWSMHQAVRDGTAIGPFEMAHLPGDERETAAEAMESWLELARLPASDRTEKDAHDFGRIVLRTLGIGFSGRGSRPSQAPHAKGLLFLDFKGIRRAGRAMVPALGSLLPAETLRVMFAFEETTTRRLLETVKQDSSGLTCLIVYLPGVLDPEQRRAAANICRKANLLAPIVDLAVFIELLSSPESDRFERLVNLTLPFTWVNPYVPNVQGRVPAEMFYGRDREVQQVVALNGPSFVYGGRQLGKSALLRRAALAITERERDAKGIYVDLNQFGVGLFAPPETLWSVLADELVKAEVLTASAAALSFDRIAKGIEKWLADSPTRRLLILLDESDAFLERDFQANYPVTHQIRGLMDRTGRRCKFVLAGLNLVQRFDRGTNHPMAHLASSSIEVGPLDGKAAFRLVHEPLHALGVRFENSDLSLIYKVLASTNDQASLIQLVCDRLLQRIALDTLGTTSPGPTITSGLMKQELNDPELQAEISRRFEWTISLDPRYKAIAYRVALEARAGSPRLSADDLLLLARLDWPVAFDALSKEEFGWYLRELSTFGVLRHHDGEWMLRSPNLIELIGSPSEIEGRLQRITSRTPEQRLDPTKLRYPRDSKGHPGPLAGDQVAAILSNAGRPTVLVASQLSGIEDATQSLHHLAETRGFVVVTRDVSAANDLPEPQGERVSGVLPNLHVVTASGLDSAGLRALLDASTQRWGRARATDELLLLVAQPNQLAAETWNDDRVVVLRPWDVAALRHQFDIENRAVSESDLESIVSTTGGWHQMLSPALATKRKTSGDFLRSLHAPPETIDALLEAAGAPDLTGASAVLMALGGGQECSEQDLVELFADTVPTSTFSMLQRLGFLVAGAEGLRLDPLASTIVGSGS